MPVREMIPELKVVVVALGVVGAIPIVESVFGRQKWFAPVMLGIGFVMLVWVAGKP